MHHNETVPETDTHPLPDPAREGPTPAEVPTPSPDEADALAGLLGVLDLLARAG